MATQNSARRPDAAGVSARADELYTERKLQNLRRIDRLFVPLMLFQWVGAVLLALRASPLAGAADATHVSHHVASAFLLGGLMSIAPVVLAVTCPGRPITRHVIGVSQMFMSGLLIQITDGRIETHFHIFGSLAFLAFYRDWSVLASASAVVGLDHLLRGLYWPASIYGSEFVEPLRWLEHGAWILFEDIFLSIAIFQGSREMRLYALRQAELEASQTVVAHLNDRLQRSMTETHHRVKNNLQLIAAMVDMRLMEQRDLIPRAEFQRLGMYVGALAGVHDLLTQEARADGQAHFISARDVLCKLLSLVAQPANGRKVLSVIDDARLPSKQATSLALVAHELVTNALKHSEADVEVTFHVSGEFAELTVSDCGAGFPDGFDSAVAANTGLELVENLVRLDLLGAVFYDNRPTGGAAVRVRFPLSATDEAAVAAPISHLAVA